ncbi:MAG: hypothetical protein R6V05_10940 [Candidatus Brocadiia bacterium]
MSVPKLLLAAWVVCAVMAAAPMRKAAPRVAPVRVPANVARKPEPDPNRINFSSPQEFVVRSSSMGTRPYGSPCAAVGGYRGYALVYEAITDEVDGGHTQAVFVMRDRDMAPLKGPRALTPKAEHSALEFVRLLRFPGPQDKFLCVYQTRLNNTDAGFYWIIDPFTMGEFGTAQALEQPNEGIELQSVRFLPGRETAVILYNTSAGARYMVIDRTGQKVYRGVPGRTIAEARKVEARDIGFLHDGQWILAGKHSGEWGVRTMDPYGQWTDAAQQIPDTNNSPLAKMEILGPDRLLVRYGYLGAGLLHFGPTRLRPIETPELRNVYASYSEPVGQERVLVAHICKQDEQFNMHAYIADASGQVLKPPQMVMRDCYSSAAFARRWGARDELVVFSASPSSNIGRFRYITIKE